MEKPLKKTMEVLDGLFRPSLQLMEASDHELAPLRAAMLRNRIDRYDDLVAAVSDKNKKVTLLEYGLLPQLFYAFDCVPLVMEAFPGFFAAAKQEVVQEFLGIAEEAGMPSDVCSTDRFIVGAALAGELPTENSFFVSGSSPCDGTRIAYPIMRKILEIPTLYIESPYTYEREAARWYGNQIKVQLIPFLEEITGKKFDIDRFREIIEESNRAYELMLDIYDTYKQSPCPHPASLRGAPYGLFFSQAGHPKVTEILTIMHEDAARRVKENIQLDVEEKSRVMWAHVPPIFDTGLFTWMEEHLGASVVTTFLSSSARLQPIDTTNMDSMLEGYAWQGLDMTMSLMRLDTKRFWDYTMKAFDDYGCDSLIVTIHVGCKSIAGCEGIWRRYAREREIPTLFLELDYNSDRILSSEPLREQLEEFFTTIVH